MISDFVSSCSSSILSSLNLVFLLIALRVSPLRLVNIGALIVHCFALHIGRLSTFSVFYVHWLVDLLKSSIAFKVLFAPKSNFNVVVVVVRFFSTSSSLVETQPSRR